MALCNGEKWEAIQRIAAEEGTDPYAALLRCIENKYEACTRCFILIRPYGGHRCGTCGRDV